MKNCWVIVNPISGKGKGRETLPLIKGRWGNKFAQLELLTTSRRGDAEKFAFHAACEGADLVVCLGGDGTIREVVTGLMKSGQSVPLGILPGGTVNDLARSLGIPRALEEALAIIERGALRSIDIGKANDEYFVSLLAAGSIPDAVRESSFQAKTKWGAWAYFFNSARYAVGRKRFLVSFRSKGTSVERASSLIVISLLNSVAGFESFFPEAVSSDGWLRARVFPVFGFLGAGWYSLLLKLGLIGHAKEVSLHRFETANLNLSARNIPPITLDGDLGPQPPVSIRILRGALPVFVKESQ